MFTVFRQVFSRFLVKKSFPMSRSRWNADGSAVVKPFAELSTEAIGKKLRESSADRSGPTAVVALPVLRQLLGPAESRGNGAGARLGPPSFYSSF